MLSEKQILSLKLTRPGTCLLAFVCRPAPITMYFGLSSSVKGWGFFVFWLFFFFYCFPSPPFLRPLPTFLPVTVTSGLGFKGMGIAGCGRCIVLVMKLSIFRAPTGLGTAQFPERRLRGEGVVSPPGGPCGAPPSSALSIIMGNRKGYAFICDCSC